MTSIALAGLKGGVGTTATACSLAVFLADYRQVGIDGLNPDQVAAYLGIGATPPIGADLAPNLRYGIPEDGWATFEVHDCGTFADVLASGSASPWWRADHCLAVTDRSYTALRAGVHESSLLNSAEYALVVSDPERALGMTEVHRVLERPVLEIPTGPAIQRIHDSGTMLVRQPDTMRRAMQRIIEKLDLMSNLTQGADA